MSTGGEGWEKGEMDEYSKKWIRRMSTRWDGWESWVQEEKDDKGEYKWDRKKIFYQKLHIMLTLF